ncbi:MAG: CvpA family protein [Candidatus Marinimicrobia bacterium]|nr:CvpA family protein [Candidatus Neomarinimicrobiota bacterium]
MNLTVFDIAALAVVGVFAFIGLRKGLIAEVFKILGIIIGITLALHYVNRVAAVVHNFAALGDKVEKAVAFILILLLTIAVFIYLARIARVIFNFALMGWLDKGGGLLFGSIKGALVISAFLPLFMFLPDSISFVKDTKRNSVAYKYLQGFAPQVYNSIAKLIPGSDNFATKIQAAFPTAGTFNKLSKRNIDPAQINLFQQFMGTDESAMLKELQKQLGDDFKVEDINFDNLNMDTGDKDKLQKLLDKTGIDSKKKPRKNRRN